MTLSLIVALGLAQADATPVNKPLPIDPTRWITDVDYPADALRRGEQGTVGFMLEVGADGMTRNCRVTASSGSPMLDANACSLMMQRARFKPASDASGKPVAATFNSRFTWRLPGNDNLSLSGYKVTINREKGGYRCTVAPADKTGSFTADECTSLAEAIARHGGNPVGTVTVRKAEAKRD